MTNRTDDQSRLRRRYFVAGLLLALAGCVSPNVPEPYVVVEVQGRAMGTTWTVQIVPEDDSCRPKEVDSGAIEEKIIARLEQLEAEMSHWRESSQVSRFNRHQSTTSIAVSNDLANVLLVALAISGRTNGAMDITTAPLVNLWGFGPNGSREDLPSDDQLAEALTHVGSERLRVMQAEDGTWTLAKTDPQVQVDLSSLAKGYAIDVLAAELDAAGHSRYLIELGGELRAQGMAITGEPWRVGLERPDPRHVGKVRRVVAISDAAIATTGNYRLFRHVEQPGKAPPVHLIDPRTGRSPTHDLVSVSVIAPTAIEADAWATALFVLGPEAGLRMATQRTLAAAFILSDGAEMSSPEFARYATE